MEVKLNKTHLWMQWAADTIQNSLIKTPPHQWPSKPYAGCSTSNDTCQGNSPSVVVEPSIIRAVLLNEPRRGSRRSVFIPQSGNMAISRENHMNFSFTRMPCKQQTFSYLYCVFRLLWILYMPEWSSTEAKKSLSGYLIIIFGSSASISLCT